MESGQKDLTIPIFIASIAFIAIALGTYIYFETGSTLKLKRADVIPNTDVVSTPPNDIYPLYAGLDWNNAESVETKLEDLSFHTFEIAAKPMKHINNVNRIIAPFQQYYDQKLKLMGWNEGSVKTHGPASSQWTYKKDKMYIILSYVYEQEKPYKGGEIKCPCTLNFDIVTGGNE